MVKKIAIIFAGGTGARMGNDGKPKQFLVVEGKPIFIHTLQFFEKHSEIDEIYVAMKKEFIDITKELLKEFNINKVVDIVAGGETGQDSIYNALSAAKKNNNDDSIVLIHDGVRPLISKDLITKNIRSVEKHNSGITSTSCVETVIISKNGKQIDNIPIRKNTYLAQAPQSFRLGDVIALHDKERILENPYENIVDTCTLYEKYGKDIVLVEGERGNIKITTPEDYFLFKALLNYRESLEVFR